MRILIDDRESNSKIKMAQQRWAGNDIEIQRLECGDYVFPDLSIAIEMKWSFKDFAESVYDGRLESQIKKMCETFDHWAVIVVGEVGDFYGDRYLTFSEAQWKGVKGRLMSCNYPFTTEKTPKAAFEMMDSFVKKCQDDGHVIKQKVMVRKTEAPDERILHALGIGSRQRKDILSEYSIRELHDVSVEQLLKIRGVGPRTAEKLKEALY